MKDSDLQHLEACPACDATTRSLYCRVPSLFDAGAFIRYERCADCDVVFRNPRPIPTVRLDAYREREPRPEHLALHPRTQTHYRYLARRLCAALPAAAPPRAFDFGCGAGGFLLEARAAGCAVSGLELNRALARHVMATHGIPVHSGEITDPALATAEFDIITSFEVFEHLLDPRSVLHDLVRHLARPGLLLIEVPNLHDLRERLRRGATMDDSHLFYFNRTSLGRLVRAQGLTVLEVHEGLRPSRLLGRRAATLPLGVYRALERTAALLQLKTVLGVIAMHPAP